MKKQLPECRENCPYCCQYRTANSGCTFPDPPLADGDRRWNGSGWHVSKCPNEQEVEKIKEHKAQFVVGARAEIMEI